MTTDRSAAEWRTLARNTGDPTLAAGFTAKAAEAERIETAASPPGTSTGWCGPGPRRLRKPTVAAVLAVLKAATPDQRAEIARELGAGIAEAKLAQPSLQKRAAQPTPALVSTITEAVKAVAAESIKGLSDDVQRMRAMAAPGGPVRRDTPAPTRPPAGDRSYLTKMAAEVDDPALAREYRHRAAEAERRERGW